jgi:hypothetical protein
MGVQCDQLICGITSRIPACRVADRPSDVFHCFRTAEGHRNMEAWSLAAPTSRFDVTPVLIGQRPAERGRAVGLAERHLVDESQQP